MAKDTIKRTVIEVSEESRDTLKAIAALQRITMRDLMEQTIKELAQRHGVSLPPPNKPE